MTVRASTAGVQRCLSVALLVAAISSRASAQRDTLPRVALGERAPKPAGPRTIAGIVVDTTGAPLDSIDVYIGSLKRRTLSATDGTFRFDDVKPGSYDVNARRIGYYPQARRMTVEKDGGVVTFVLVPSPRSLAPVVTVSARGGLSGVVGDTAFRALPGAQVMVLASTYRTVADSTGAFFLPVRPGTYMVRVKMEGYESHLVSVRIPSDSGRRVMVWLAPPSGGPSHREELNMQALQFRMELRKPSSRVITREDLLNSSMTELSQVVQQAAIMPVGDGCAVYIDGGPRMARLWELRTEDIETVEVYPPGSLPSSARPLRGNQYRGNIGGGASGLVPSGGGGCSDVIVFAWLRK